MPDLVNKNGLEASNSKVNSRKRGGMMREQNTVVCDTIRALALCHNVTPTFPDDAKEEVEYQASSPDEIALVKFAATMGMNLVERDQHYINIKNAANAPEKYEVLANFPFTSESKRMGIILKHTESGTIVFYLKGAEVVMKQKVRAHNRATVDEACENLALEGLRTLVISQKLVTESFYEDWNKRYQRALSDLNNREGMIAKCLEEIELDMELLAITGVEGKEDKKTDVSFR